MAEQLTKENLKKIIFEAFKDVPKGIGLGARECQAEDDYAGPEEKMAARALDIEQHWWEYPKDLIESWVLDQSLNYNNKDGIKFHLPAIMTADLDGFGNTGEITVFYHLCLENFQKRPHHGHREYVAFMKSVDVSKIIEYYNFNPAQVHAIALYFLYDMQEISSYHFFDSREDMIDLIKQSHESSLKGAGKGNYTLTLEDAIAIADEEHRIVRDWFRAGNVASHDYLIVDAEL